MLAQISAGPTTAHARLATLHALQRLVKCRAAAWLDTAMAKSFRDQICCAFPRNFGELLPPKELLEVLNQPPTFEQEGMPFSLGDAPDGKFLVCRTLTENEGLVFWGLKREPPQRVLKKMAIVLQHGQLSMLNLQRTETFRAQTCMDDLTGLWNLRALRNDLLTLTSSHPFAEDNFSVVFVDVDRLKVLNDQYGHLVGSECLVAISQLLSQSVRATDSVYRYGGDEFVIVLRHTRAREALLVCERIRKSIELHRFTVGPFNLRLTVSVGLATFPDHGTDLDALLRLADEAMYQAKKKTKNAVSMAGRSSQLVTALAR